MEIIAHIVGAESRPQGTRAHTAQQEPARRAMAQRVK